MTEFNPMDGPTECPFCRDHPDWEEVWHEAYQCQNCLAIIDSHGNVVKEPVPDDFDDNDDDDDDDDDDLFDEDE